MKYNKIIIILIVVFCTALFGKILLYNNIKDPVKVNIKTGETIETSVEAKLDTKKSKNVMLVVHVKGQVKNPGVYKFKEESRVIDAVNAAGGVTTDGDINAVNLAAPIIDGQEIYIPAEGEEIVYNGDSINGKININSADSDKLSTLPGIGESIAEEIIRYRHVNHGFKSIEEIKNVKRIGDKTYEKIKDLITIY